MGLDLCPEGRICAYPVILPVAQDHTPVKSRVSGFSCGNDLQFSRFKICLLNAVVVLKDLQDAVLHSVLIAIILFPAGLSVPVDQNGLVPDDHIEHLSLHNCGSGFLHLLLREMDEEVRDEKDRIVFVLADPDNDRLTALLDDHAMDRQRQCDIVIFLDPAVIMGVEIGDAGVLIQRILLHIKSGRIDMRAENVQAVLKRLCSNLKEHH